MPPRQGALRFGGVGDGQPPLRAVAKCFLDLFAEVGVVDDDIAEAGCGQRLDVPDDQRLAAATSSGWGVWSVSGRMRSPRPAARIMAFMAYL